ncbi:MAG: homoserine dehydrogenase [Chitinophagaceae bacterium]|nr:homoserine dehydrogenase [Chitinophagaceae bacterium]
METNKQLTIGLFGFGVVGEGLYKVLQLTPSLNATIKKVCIKNSGKKRNAPDTLFTTDRNELLNDRDINIIVEMIDEAEAAFEIVTTAMRNGKDVVSASKKMIAENLSALLEVQLQTGRSFLYEPAACASIPVIRNLEEYYDNDLLYSIRAILNGSTNFILTKIAEEGLDFKEALLLASKNQQIKLVAQAQKLKNGKIAAFVLPQFVKQDDHLAFVKDEYNGVVIESSFADKQFFYGKGAGSFPTASAVLSDISALRYQYKYEYKKLYHHKPHELTNDFFLRVYVSFDQLSYIPREEFEWIEEWYVQEDRKYLAGVIAFSKLTQNNWWKENNTSLILFPEPVIEEIETRKLKKRSLELAGII